MRAVPKRIERPTPVQLALVRTPPPAPLEPRAGSEARAPAPAPARPPADPPMLAALPSPSSGPRFVSSRTQRADPKGSRFGDRSKQKLYGAKASARDTDRAAEEGAKKRVKPEATPVQRALKLLSSRSRTAQELLRALGRAGVTLEESKAALARMRELGYIDDASVAEARAKRLVGRGDSPRLVTRRLQMQGVSADAAKTAAEQAAAGASEDELAAEALAKRLRGRPVRDEREKQRLLRSLVQHGHRPSSAAKALQLSMESSGAESLDDVEGDLDGE
jgi:regulatory protein